jgi:hypothetical protein
VSDPRDAKRIEEMQERLDHVEEEIEEARRDAEKVLPKPPKESFAQNGTVGGDQRDDDVTPTELSIFSESVLG